MYSSNSPQLEVGENRKSTPYNTTVEAATGKMYSGSVHDFKWTTTAENKTKVDCNAWRAGRELLEVFFFFLFNIIHTPRFGDNNSMEKRNSFEIP